VSDFDLETFEVEIERSDETVRYRDGFESYRLTSNYMTPTDAWEFTVFSDDNPFELRRRWRPLQPVKLYISGNLQVIGRIDGIEGVGDGGTKLRVWGRDYLADLVDATVDPQFQVKKGQDIGAVFEELFAPFGIKTILGSFNLTRDLLTGKRPYFGEPERSFRAAQLDDFKAEDNQGVMEFAMKIASRHGFTILPGGTRDSIVIDRPNYLQAPLLELSRPGNIISASARRDYSSVPTVTIARGRGGDASGGAKGEFPTFDKSGGAPSSIGSVPEVQRTITAENNIIAVRETRWDPKKPDRTIYGFDPPLYRPLFYRDRDARNGEQLDYSVRKMIAERLRDTLTYSVEMRGHTETTSGAVYAVDTIARVNDTIEDVNENLWVLERTFENMGGGPRTTMELLRPESYVL
jgi:prophage tail gpP-like protein